MHCYIYVCIYIFLYVNIYIYIYIYIIMYIYLCIYINMYVYIHKYWKYCLWRGQTLFSFYIDTNYMLNSHKRINVDHGINVDQNSKPRNKCKYSILYLHLFRGFECWSPLIPRWEINFILLYLTYIWSHNHS
jgi:hypothetical protein